MSLCALEQLAQILLTNHINGAMRAACLHKEEPTFVFHPHNQVGGLSMLGNCDSKAIKDWMAASILLFIGIINEDNLSTWSVSRAELFDHCFYQEVLSSSR